MHFIHHRYYKAKWMATLFNFICDLRLSYFKKPKNENCMSTDTKQVVKCLLSFAQLKIEHEQQI